MKKLFVTLLLVLSALQPASAQRPLKTIAADLQRIATELSTTVVPEGGDLQVALDGGGMIEFEGTHIAPVRFTVTVSGTRLIGRPGAKLVGSREAIVIMPGVHDVELANFQATSSGTESVVRVGANDTTQTTVLQEPYDITLRKVLVPTHRGKRGFEINSRDTLVEDCFVLDTWSTAGADSQGLSIYNSSGNIIVRGGIYEAGSENILVGGAVSMMGAVPTNLRFEFVHLRKPISWRTDGIKRVVKNLFELKTGNYVTLTNSVLDGCWRDGQTGFAIVLTPTRDGRVTNVMILDNVIKNVGSGIQILGRAYSYYTPTRLGLTFDRNTVNVDHNIFGGFGYLATIEAEPDYIWMHDNKVFLTGTSLLTYRYGTVMLEDGTTRAGGPMNSFVFTGNTANVGQYGLNLLGYPNGGPKKEGFAAATILDVSGNTFSGAAALFKTNFPNNTWQ